LKGSARSVSAACARPRPSARDHAAPCRLDVVLAEGRFVGLGRRQPHRAPARQKEVELDGAQPRHLRGGVALDAANDAVRRQEHEVAHLDRAAQLLERHAFAGEPLQQCEALLLLIALEPLQQPLRGEVDALLGHLPAH
jgi:hypothetical protein